MNFEEMEKLSKDFYDTIDFKKYIDDNNFNCLKQPLSDIINSLEDYYDNQHPYLLPEAFEGSFFNFISTDEFADYLRERYGWRIDEEVVTNYYIIS